MRFRFFRKRKEEKEQTTRDRSQYSPDPRFKFERQRNTSRRDSGRIKYSRNFSLVTRRILSMFSIKRFILLIIVFVLPILFIDFLFGSPEFSLRILRVVGADYVGNDVVIEGLKEKLGENVFSINSGSIEEMLYAEYPYFKKVFVSKVLPSTLLVEVEEFIPQAIIIDADNYYVVDEDGYNIISQTIEPIVLTDLEQRFYLNRFSADNDLVRVEVERNLTDEELETYNWEEYDKAKKERVRATLSEELEKRVVEHGAKAFETISERVKQGLNYFVVLGKYEDIDIDTFNQLLGAIDDFGREKEIEIRDFIWVSNFRVEVYLSSGTLWIFSGEKNIQEQIISLDLLQQKEDIAGVRYIDLRSNIIAVR